MKFDKYFITARVYPSIIILIPFLLFTIYCEIANLQDVFDDVLKIKIVGNLTVSIVLLYLLVQVNRFLGKFLFEKKIFKNEMEMPTTNYLLYSNNEFSDDYKNQLRKQITIDFKINLPNPEEENANITNARKRILEAVGLIRQKVKNGRLLLQHNIEYGFARNLIGGSVIGIIISSFDVIYFYSHKNILITIISAVFLIVFAFLLLFHKLIIKHLGNQYAKRLFQEYLQK